MAPTTPANRAVATPEASTHPTAARAASTQASQPRPVGRSSTASSSEPTAATAARAPNRAELGGVTTATDHVDDADQQQPESKTAHRAVPAVVKSIC